MSKYWNPLVHSLTPYVPGEQPQLADLVKLNTNETPYPPSPRAQEAMRAAVDGDLRRYPDPEGQQLKAALMRHFSACGIAPEQIFLGNGSDEVLAHVFLALFRRERRGLPLPLLFPDVTYSFYPSWCRLYEIPWRTAAVSGQFELRIEDYLLGNSADAPGGILFPNPNAPTGRLLPLSDVERIVAANPETVVVIDEAYIDFAGDEPASIPTAVALINRFPNLLVVQTLSKSRSLAGLRVGFAIGNAELITGLERVKNSFNSYPLDRIALAGAAAAVEDEDWFGRMRLAVMETRARLSAGLEALEFEVLPSSSNFIFARHPRRDAQSLSAALRARNIIVRHFKQPRIEQFLRISIGNDEECQRLLVALEEILAGS
ncbi:MAG: histidinol-phosphate transaminase [Betaproteobacteria bacterium]|nr:histidinol-phosphate transaminase [Betaproteobacteria bacterium]